MKVSDIMKKAIVVDDSSITLKQAAKIMTERKIGSLIILKEDKIIGILTESDVVKDIDSINKKLSELMSKDIISIDKNSIIEDAARLMKQNKIKRLPVLDGKNLVGIITATDIIQSSNELNEDFFFD
ncbi:MAG: CBS domain-containing protein [Candidatus Nanoarchaeia archaeon]|jgi:CBS domain-containing protein|nr:CBS domain-containing protein [Candidatus Nanoarchaeia archaeon]